MVESNKSEDMKEEGKTSGRYILMTPVKNEEINLPEVVQSVVNQTVKPLLWVIVDDGSTDHTPDIIKEVKGKYNWIQSIRLNGTARDIGLHIANVMKKGFDFAIGYCRNKGIVFDYLGNVDGDTFLDFRYYEILITRFTKNPMLGIAGGEEWFFEGNQKLLKKYRLPYGGAILIKTKCFEDCGGIPLAPAWDSVINVKAKLRGWKSELFVDAKQFTRKADSAEGLWKGYKERAKSDYFLGFNFLHAMVKGLMLSLEKPYYTGFAFLYGYLSSLILRKKQIDDKEIKNYYRYNKSQEAIRYYVDMLKEHIKKKR